MRCNDVPVRRLRLNTRPATGFTLLGALYCTPGIQLPLVYFTPGAWPGYLVIAVPFGYCVYRLLAAPVARVGWPRTIIASAAGVVMTVSVFAAPFSDSTIWAEVPFMALSVPGYFAFARRNLQQLRPEKAIAAL